MAEQERHNIILWPQFTPSWTKYQYMFSAHKNDYAWWNIFSCGNMPMRCTVRCILYIRVYVENMILVSELYCYYICLFYQMWVSAVQKQSMVNRKGVKNINVKKKIISPRCNKMIKSALSVTPLRSASSFQIYFSQYGLVQNQSWQTFLATKCDSSFLSLWNSS